MEKILFGAYLSILAAFITAAASIVKLVNEKESKTTDYRQSWTESVRKSLSQLIASISLQANYLVTRTELAHTLAATHAKKVESDQEKLKDSVADHLAEQLAELNSSIRENRQSIQQNYALTALHFKPHDEIFAKIESKFEAVNLLLEEMVRLKDENKSGERKVLKEKVGAIVAEITETSRFILKTEWESVKRGEPAYKATKSWSLYVGVSTFAILLVSGIYMLAVAGLSPGSSVVTSSVREARSDLRESDSGRNDVRQEVTINSVGCVPARVATNKPRGACEASPVKSADKIGVENER